jgi:hypothetical protein
MNGFIVQRSAAEHADQPSMLTVDTLVFITGHGGVGWYIQIQHLDSKKRPWLAAVHSLKKNCYNTTDEQSQMKVIRIDLIQYQ